MSIRKKTLIINIILVILLGITYLVATKPIIEGFVKIEKNETENDVKRAIDALNNVVTSLDTKSVDWSAWDDTYQFIQDKNRNYIKSNLQNHSLGSLKINMMIFLNNKSEVVMSKNIDLNNEKDVVLPQSLESLLQKENRLLQHSSTDSVVRGILNIPEGTLLIASRPIIKSSGDGPAMGTLIFARFLDKDLSKQLAELIHLPVIFKPVSENSISELGLPNSFIDSSNHLLTQNLNADTIAGYGLVNDIYDKQALIAKIELPRLIYKQGINTIISSIAVFSIFFIVFGLIEQLILEILIIGRVYKLKEKVLLIGKTHKGDERVTVSGNDEISLLGQGINNMLNELDNAGEALKREKENVEAKVVERTRELSEKSTALNSAKEEISKGWLQLQREKARLSASINSLSLGFIMTDTLGIIITSNPAVSRILGLKNTRFDLETVSKSIPKVNLTSQLASAMKNKKTVAIKNIPYNEAYIRILITPILISEGIEDVIGAVILIEDITEAKTLERTRDEFFSIASHELRTPLTSIRGNSSMIMDYYRDKLADKSLKEMVEDIHEGSIRLIEIVNDFLDMSRLEMKKIEFKKQEFDCLQSVKHVIEQLQTTAKDKSLDIKIEFPQNLPMIMGDEDRLEQIMFNLIGNAIKFTQKGTVTISAKPEGQFLKISVSDTGQGISKQNQTLLFKKFQQASENIYTRDTTRGTGLGLYISKLMIEGMGGTINLERSEENKGSTFSFTIPTAISSPSPQVSRTKE